MVAIATMLAACGSSSDHTARSVSSGTIPPSTLLTPADGVSVPFTADNGTLVVTAGAQPDDVSADDAVATLNRVRNSQGTPPKLLAVLKGDVTLAPGLSPTPLVDTPAWVVVYTQEYVASCPAQPAGQSTPTAPPTASHLTAVIVTSDTVLGYLGAGTGVCEPRAVPVVVTAAQLESGQV